MKYARILCLAGLTVFQAFGELLRVFYQRVMSVSEGEVLQGGNGARQVIQRRLAKALRLCWIQTG